MTNTKLHTENNAWMNTKRISEYRANCLDKDKKPPCKSIQWQQLRKQRKWCYHIHFFGHPVSPQIPLLFFLAFYITAYLCIYQRGYLLAANFKIFSFLYKLSFDGLCHHRYSFIYRTGLWYMLLLFLGWRNYFSPLNPDEMFLFLTTMLAYLFEFQHRFSHLSLLYFKQNEIFMLQIECP